MLLAFLQAVQLTEEKAEAGAEYHMIMSSTTNPSVYHEGFGLWLALQSACADLLLAAIAKQLALPGPLLVCQPVAAFMLSSQTGTEFWPCHGT